MERKNHMIRDCKFCEHSFRVKATSRRTRCNRDECNKARHREIKRLFREKHPRIWRERSRLAMQKMRAKRAGKKLKAGSVEQQVHVKVTRSDAYAERERARKKAYNERRKAMRAAQGNSQPTVEV